MSSIKRGVLEMECHSDGRLCYEKYGEGVSTWNPVPSYSSGRGASEPSRGVISRRARRLRASWRITSSNNKKHSSNNEKNYNCNNINDNENDINNHSNNSSNNK